jgi:hypothetical protein
VRPDSNRHGNWGGDAHVRMAVLTVRWPKLMVQVDCGGQSR